MRETVVFLIGGRTMFAAARIRQLIDSINQLFTTRQFLSYGSRGAVDQALY